MSLAAFIETMRELGDAAWQVCECGDYRYEHDHGAGACGVCASHWQPWPRCRRFRYSHGPDADELAKRRQEWAAVLTQDGRP